MELEVQMFERALKAYEQDIRREERERCAQIADVFARKDWPKDEPRAELLAAQSDHAALIASAIRSQR
ncbi:hypothetical protein IP84_16930 [beta proteobacterium AAP99]|nr:hypothetical protein IP84_16930 [beta proteobacterium AAP99]